MKMVVDSSPSPYPLRGKNTHQLHLSLGDFKQHVQRLNNQINQSIFKTGLKEQRVEVLKDKVLILSKHSRAHLLQSLDELDPQASRTLDLYLLQKYKSDLKRVFEEEFQINVLSVLKDYDPETELAGTMILFSQDIQFTS
ncbi:DUF2294 domain-containing protein [Evansella sp. AB-rgal1]|uniref:DUF2294 domain-containing protein n=1 Tax=Evansella sp. AB-rgal1 TaxID=3242696 RepID=UPI00359CFE1D